MLLNELLQHILCHLSESSGARCCNVFEGGGHLALENQLDKDLLLFPSVDFEPPFGSLACS